MRTSNGVCACAIYGVIRFSLISDCIRVYGWELDKFNFEKTIFFLNFSNFFRTFKPLFGKKWFLPTRFNKHVSFIVLPTIRHIYLVGSFCRISLCVGSNEHCVVKITFFSNLFELDLIEVNYSTRPVLRLNRAVLFCDLSVRLNWSDFEDFNI